MITLLFDRKSLMLVSACGMALALSLFFGGAAVGLRIQLETASLNALTDSGPGASRLASPPSESPAAASVRARELPSSPQEVQASATGALPDWDSRDFEPWDPMATGLQDPGAWNADRDPNRQASPPEDRLRAASNPGTSEAERRVRSRAADLPGEFLLTSHSQSPSRDEEPSGWPSRRAVDRSTAVPASSSDEQEHADGFTVQVGAYGHKDNAAAQIAALRAAGWDSVLITEVGDPTRALFAVRLGRFPDRGSALQHAQRFRSATDQDAIVRPLLGTERDSL